MAFEPVASPDPPTVQRKLLIAAGLFTKELAQITHPAATTARSATAENVLYVIWLRLLQMARSLQGSCYLGYANEQFGLARSMVNAASDLVFISRQDKPSNWAMLYAMFSIERRKRIVKGYVEIGLWPEEVAKKWDAEQNDREKKTIAEAASAGITPAEKHNRHSRRAPQTWSGLSDFEIINRTGKPWYQGYYVPFSDWAHANVMAAEEELRQLKAGEVSIGPRFPAGPLAYVLTCMGDTVAVGAKVINDYFRLGKDSEVKAHHDAMLKALREYRDTLPKGPEVLGA